MALGRVHSAAMGKVLESTVVGLLLDRRPHPGCEGVDRGQAREALCAGSPGLRALRSQASSRQTTQHLSFQPWVPSRPQPLEDRDHVLFTQQQ